MSKFLKIIVNIVLVCALLSAAALLVPSLLGVEMNIIENISKYPKSPMRLCHGFCERRTSSWSHAFSEEPCAVALIKVHRL